jgi:hypothetical protein
MQSHGSSHAGHNVFSRNSSAILRLIALITGAFLASSFTPSALVAASPMPPSPQSGALNPPYLQSFPSVDQVMVLKGKDAKDSTMLQLGALRQLQKMIQDLAGHRWFQHQLTPDEQRLLGQYSVAYEKLAHPLNYPDDDYFGSGALLKLLAANFKMDAVISQWHAGGVAATKFTDDHLPTPHAPSTGGGGASPSGGGTTSGPLRAIPPSGDPARAAIIRCLELGGADLDCLGGGMKLGLKELGAPDPDMAILPIFGLRVIGVFQSSSSGVNLRFTDPSVTINGCKGLDVGPTLKYSLQVLGGQFAVRIENQPAAFLAGLSNDGKLAAPASVQVNGQVITGYRLGTEYKVDGNGMKIPGSEHQVRTPILAPKTVTCSIGSLVAGAPQLPDEGVISGFADMLVLAMGTFSPDAKQVADKRYDQKAVPPGVRFLGNYANSTGMKLEFAEGPVVVDCAQAHVSAAYTISASGGTAAITVQDGAAPFTVVVQPDGSLAGTGTATVNGRLMAGFDADNHPAYSPTSATCSVGKFSAQK